VVFASVGSRQAANRPGTARGRARGRRTPASRSRSSSTSSWRDSTAAAIVTAVRAARRRLGGRTHRHLHPRARPIARWAGAPRERSVVPHDGGDRRAPPASLVDGEAVLTVGKARAPLSCNPTKDDERRLISVTGRARRGSFPLVPGRARRPDVSARRPGSAGSSPAARSTGRAESRQLRAKSRASPRRAPAARPRVLHTRPGRRRRARGGRDHGPRVPWIEVGRGPLRSLSLLSLFAPPPREISPSRLRPRSRRPCFFPRARLLPKRPPRRSPRTTIRARVAYDLGEGPVVAQRVRRLPASRPTASRQVKLAAAEQAIATAFREVDRNGVPRGPRGAPSRVSIDVRDEGAGHVQQGPVQTRTQPNQHVILFRDRRSGRTPTRTNNPRAHDGHVRSRYR